MAEPIRIELDGVPLVIAGAQGWQEVPGVSAHVAVLEVEASQAERLMAEARPFGSLLRMTDGTRELEVRRLTILGTAPTRDQHTVALSLADPRWAWRYRFVARTYNLRRKTTQTRSAVDGPANVPADVARAREVVVGDEVYHLWSLRPDGARWTGADVVRDLLDELAGPDGWHDPEGVLSQGLPDVEGLELQAQGDTALSMALAALGGAVGITYDGPSGRVEVYAPHDGGERAEVGLANRTRPRSEGRALWGEQLFSVQDNRMLRPRAVRVLFERDVELRIDAAETEDDAGTVLTGSSASTRTRGERIARATAVNVIPVPEDASIQAVGGRQARTVTRGTYVPLADYLAWLASDPAGNTLAETRPLTAALLRSLWFSALDAYAAPRYDRGGRWAARIAALREHYRRTYLLEPPWRDRLRAMLPVRAPLEDPESGARAPALVVQDYAVLYAWDPTSEAPTDAQEYALLRNRWPTGIPSLASLGLSQPPRLRDVALRDLEPSPARVEVADADTGLIRVTMPSADWRGEVATYTRGAVNEVGLPSAEPGARNFLLERAEFYAVHDVVVVLTVRLGAPNDSRRLYAVEVPEREALALLPGAASLPAPAGEAQGPVLEVRVGMQRAVARYAWDDGRRDLLDAAAAGQGDLDAALGDPLNLDELRAVARAVAAREVGRWRDRPEGARVTWFDPERRVRGSVGRVEHVADPERGLTTRVELPPEPAPLDPAALLPRDVRRVLEGWVA